MVSKVIILLILAFLFSSHAYAYEKLIFFDDFSHDQRWIEVFNQQFEDSSQTCFTQDSAPTNWKIKNGQARLNIEQSHPCKVILIPEMPDIPVSSERIVEFNMLIADRNQDRNWILQWQDENNYFGFHIFGETIQAEKYHQGVAENLQPHFVHYPFQNNENYFIRLEQSFEHSSVTIYINGQLIETFAYGSEVTDDRGLPGLAGSVGVARSNSHVQYDNFRILIESTDLPDTLAVPLITQTHPDWSKQVYDQADLWSPNEPSIGRWGCALTSAAMVFHFHGLTRFPDGEPLTPATLNTWLQSQTDGYVADGLINWRALTRLSQEISEHWFVPSLEFRYVSFIDSPNNWILRSLSEGSPPIVQIVDHFLVVHGARSLEDFLVRDPAFNLDSRLGDEFLSARLFLPSNGNLQAVSLFVPEGTVVRGSPEWQIFKTSTPKLHDLWHIWDISKPQESQYHLQVANPDIKRHTIYLFTYNQVGIVQNVSFTLPAQIPPQLLTLSRSLDEGWHIAGSRIPWKALTQLELISLLQSNAMASPWMVSWLLEQQKQLQEQPNLDQAMVWQTLILNQLQTWRSQGWINEQIIDVWTRSSEQQLRERFP